MSIHAMEVTFEPNGWRPDFKATCSDPSADCHYICAEGCESWDEMVRNEDGRVLGHSWDDRDPTALHYMEHVEDCTFIHWFDASDDATEDMVGAPITLTIPAKFTFVASDEGVRWEAIS